MHRTGCLVTAHLVLQGLEDPSLLAEDFVFAAPVIYLKKQEFIGALARFKVKDAFPGEDRAQAQLYSERLSSDTYKSGWF
jgi:hypothetical protein